MYQHHISDFPNFKPVKSSVAIETRESNQSLYRIFVFMGELTNWPDKIVSRNRALDSRHQQRRRRVRENFKKSSYLLVTVGLDNAIYQKNFVEHGKRHYVLLPLLCLNYQVLSKTKK
jgi:hypothetical protein